jgi:hypothetical protein
MYGSVNEAERTTMDEMQHGHHRETHVPRPHRKRDIGTAFLNCGVFRL